MVIADDHPLLIEGVRQSLEEAGGFEVVGTARSGGEAVAAVKRSSPDVVLLDIRMPGIDGLVCLDQIRGFSSEVKVIVLSGLDDPDLIENVLRRGAVAFVVKSVNPDDLPYVIRQAVAQTVFASAHLAPSRSDTGGTARELSSRELELLGALAAGRTNRQIGRDLFIAPATVKYHLANLYRKLRGQQPDRGGVVCPPARARGGTRAQRGIALMPRRRGR